MNIKQLVIACWPTINMNQQNKTTTTKHEICILTFLIEPEFWLIIINEKFSHYIFYTGH